MLAKNAKMGRGITRGLSSKFEVKKSKWYMLKPNGIFKLIWDLVINTIFTISFFLIPLVLCTKGELLDDFRWVEFAFDILLFLDIVVMFFTAPHDDL